MSEVLKHSESLFLNDGDIVLAAPSSATPRTWLLFRVDKIFLARHSPIFRDMLSFSSGTGPNDTYEGVPRVNLTDIAEDLELLLAGMYNAA